MKKQAKATSKVKKSTKKSVKPKVKANSKSSSPKKLLMKLAEDPKLKKAMEEMDHGANKEKVEHFRETIQDFMKTTKSFIGSKRALKLAAYVEVMIVAYRLGLALKTNILDRPEVKKYFEAYPAYKVARSFINSAIKKVEPRPNENLNDTLAADEEPPLNRQERRHGKKKEDSAVHSQFIPDHKGTPPKHA